MVQRLKYREKSHHFQGSFEVNIKQYGEQQTIEDWFQFHSNNKINLRIEKVPMKIPPPIYSKEVTGQGKENSVRILIVRFAFHNTRIFCVILRIFQYRFQFLSIPNFGGKFF